MDTLIGGGGLSKPGLKHGGNFKTRYLLCKSVCIGGLILLFFKNGGMGSHGLPVPNIVRGGVFIVSKYLLFVLQIEYNKPKQANL